MTRIVALFAALIIGGLSVKRPADPQPTAECHATAPGARSQADDVRCALVAQVMPARDGAAPAPPPAPATAPTSGRIGMNLVVSNFYGGQYPFIDRMKSAGPWQATMWGGNANAKLSFDARGWPAAIPAGANGVSTAVPLDPYVPGGVNRYVVTWDGTGDMRGSGEIKVVKSDAHRLVFDLVSAQPYLQFTAENFTAADPMRNITFVRADQEVLLKAGKVFNPAFLDRVKLFSPIRFMEWGMINGNMTTSWSQRAPVDHFSWSDTSVPVEVMVRLANEAHVEPWFCIPAHADDEYVRQFATYVRDHLDADLKPHFEYSNEVWNGSFEQARWAGEQGKAVLGVNDNPNEVFYGYRAAQVAKIVRSVMGDRPVRMVAGFFPAWAPAAPYVFQGIAKVGDASKLFDEYAITTYWGGAFAGANPHDVALIVGWAKAGQAGIDAAFDAMMRGGVFERNTDSLPAVAAIYPPHAVLAKRYGLDLVAYEGGFGADSYNSFGADSALVLDFIRRLKASPRMGVATKRMADDFFAAGGRTLTYFNDIGDVSTQGTRGVTKTIYARSPILDALEAFAAKR